MSHNESTTMSHNKCYGSTLTIDQQGHLVFL
jgi:hypothetical protein